MQTPYFKMFKGLISSIISNIQVIIVLQHSNLQHGNLATIWIIQQVVYVHVVCDVGIMLLNIVWAVYWCEGCHRDSYLGSVSIYQKKWKPRFSALFHHTLVIKLFYVPVLAVLQLSKQYPWNLILEIMGLPFNGLPVITGQSKSLNPNPNPSLSAKLFSPFVYTIV